MFEDNIRKSQSEASIDVRKVKLSDSRPSPAPPTLKERAEPSLPAAVVEEKRPSPAVLLRSKPAQESVTTTQVRFERSQKKHCPK